ncbi:MAG: DNA replication/repair protein RecF [Clostridiales bacterium]|nr:DNA replication/repair protein RecF [Clostridiales bacterium]
MRLISLRLNDFRNYEQEEVFWHPRLNVISGSNAQGKTNLLEAVSYLGLAASFRDAPDHELIRWQKELFFIEGEAESLSGSLLISAAYNREKRKNWKINGQTKDKYNDIFGNFHTVTFSPEDLYLVKSGPEARRRFLNREMVQLYPDFCSLLTRYGKVLRQRNALLKENSFSAGELAPWDEQLADLGSRLILRRHETILRLEPLAEQAHRFLSAGAEELSLSYATLAAPQKLTRMRLEDLKDFFTAELARLAAAERLRGTTLAGPHRDDLLVRIDGREARSFASQGQQRTAVLSLKLAELSLAENVRGETPVLLLDDVMSELDPERRRQLLGLILGRAQTFITGTEIEFDPAEGKKFLVEAGKIREQI